MDQTGGKQNSFGIGIDIEGVYRFRKLSTDIPFLQRVFTQKELDYCFSHKSPAPHLAVRFAAKEAVIKALSSLRKTGLAYKDIEVINDENGVPLARIRKAGFERLQINLTLSHSSSQAIALAMITETPSVE